jgi:NADPH-dependent 2,4-dienoyl-CoA reductase/sulfur reductase-like enzyme
MNEPNKKIVPFQSPGSPVLDRADIVIIGNGIAGLTAAVEARRLAPEKRIVIVTDQIHPTINTPALKQFAVAKLTREQLLAYPAGTERAERLHIVHSRVAEIHAQSKYVTLTGNRGFGYNSLLIATGSSPQGLPEQTPGRTFDGVLTLHRLQDYLDLRRRLGEVSEAVVIGGGVHAIETVMGLLYWGIRVHWLIRGKTFMRGMLDEIASEIVLSNIRHAGAVVHLETEVAGVVGRVGSVAGVITNHQEMIPCQLVLTCTGTKPAMTLAKKCSVPMMHKNGIVVDDKLRTSVRDIYAAGDVAALKNPLTGKYEPRAQWYAAVSQGRIAGSIMVGNKELSQQPFGVFWHATHLGELSMLTVGEPLSKDPGIVIRTDTSQGGYRRLAMVDNRLVGYLALGSKQSDSLAIKRIIDEGTPIDNGVKALLKGQFDARSYVSNQRSQATRNLLTNKLPLLNNGGAQQAPMQIPMQAPMLLPETYNYAGNGLPSTDPLPLNQPQMPVAPQHVPIEQYLDRQPIGMADVPVYYDDEINPFTGNLPAPTPPQPEFARRMPEPLQTPPQPEFTRRMTEPEPTPYVYANQAPVPPQDRQPISNRQSQKHYNLWTFADQPVEAQAIVLDISREERR